MVGRGSRCDRCGCQDGNGLQFPKVRDLAAWLGCCSDYIAGQQMFAWHQQTPQSLCEKILVHGERSCFRHLDQTVIAQEAGSTDFGPDVSEYDRCRSGGQDGSHCPVVFGQPGALK